MHRRLNRRRVRTAAHLEAAVLRHGALDEEIGHLDGEGLQEEDAVQRLGARRSAPKLEVPRAREDDAPLHDVIGHQLKELARNRRSEQARRAVRWRQLRCQEWVGNHDPLEHTPPMQQQAGRRHNRRAHNR